MRIFITFLTVNLLFLNSITLAQNNTISKSDSLLNNKKEKQSNDAVKQKRVGCFDEGFASTELENTNKGYVRVPPLDINFKNGILHISGSILLECCTNTKIFVSYSDSTISLCIPDHDDGAICM